MSLAAERVGPEPDGGRPLSPIHRRVHEYGGASFAWAGDKIVFSVVEGPVFEVAQLASGAWGTPLQISPSPSPFCPPSFPPLTRTPPFQRAKCTASPTLRLTRRTLPSSSPYSRTTPSTSPRRSSTHSSCSTLPPRPSTQSRLGLTFIRRPAGPPLLTVRPPLGPGREVSADLVNSRICWIQWAHPDMPWEGSELWVGKYEDKAIVPGSQQHLAGVKAGVESSSQPRWSTISERETLVFLSDRTGFYEMYQWSEGKEVELLAKHPGGSDVGGAFLLNPFLSQTRH